MSRRACGERRSSPARAALGALAASLLAGALAGAFPAAVAAGSVPGTTAGTSPGRDLSQEEAGRRSVGDGSTPAEVAAAQLSEAELDALTAAVADRLRCPVCRNQSVLESSSELARRMQAVIRERLAAGDSPEEVVAYFVARYGEWILLQPKPRGINWIVYLLPAALVLAGGLLLGSRILAWRAARADRAEVGARRTARVGPAAREDPSGAAERGVEAGLTEGDEAWLDEAIRAG